MSNILSASSRTKYVQRRQFVTRPGRKKKHLAYQLGQLVQLLTKSNNKNISSSFEITIIRRQHVYHPARSANNDFCSTFELCNLMKKTVMTKKINGVDFSEENQQTFR